MEEKKLTVSIRRDIEARVADSTTVNLYTYREDEGGWLLRKCESDVHEDTCQFILRNETESYRANVESRRRPGSIVEKYCKCSRGWEFRVIKDEPFESHIELVLDTCMVMVNKTPVRRANRKKETVYVDVSTGKISPMGKMAGIQLYQPWMNPWEV